MQDKRGKWQTHASCNWEATGTVEVALEKFILEINITVVNTLCNCRSWPHSFNVPSFGICFDGRKTGYFICGKIACTLWLRLYL